MPNTLSRAHLIGIIILARFLKLPLTRYEAMIEKVEDSPMFRQLWPGIISTNLFPKARVLEPGRIPTPNAIGQLRKDEKGFYVSYRHAGLTREYFFDERNMRRWRLRPEGFSVSAQPNAQPEGRSQALSASDEAQIQALRRQLRLINSRNRLTHMILMGIAEHQGAYLASGDTLHLRPLSQVALADVEIDYPLCSGGMVYIGSAKNLRKRLRDHLRPNSKNGDLGALLDSHRCSFRYILVRRDLREAEKELCHSFSAAYGSLPRCNRISP